MRPSKIETSDHSSDPVCEKALMEAAGMEFRKEFDSQQDLCCIFPLASIISTVTPRCSVPAVGRCCVHEI